MNGLNGFQRDLLYVVAGLSAPNGLAIKDEIEHYYESEIQPARLYPNLDTLVEHGYVEKEPTDSRANRYILTAAGAEALTARQAWKARYLDAGD